MREATPVHRVGVLVGSLGATQLAYHLLFQGNEHLKRGVNLDLIVFWQNIVKAWTTPSFAMMNISEAYDFSGVAVATDLATASRLKHLPGPKSRYFYVWDLEWVLTAGSYERHQEIYGDLSLPLLARSRQHADVIEDAWARPVRAVIDNCNLTELIRVISEDGGRNAQEAQGIRSGRSGGSRDRKGGSGGGRVTPAVA